jgi:prevent-host-death family protein
MIVNMHEAKTHFSQLVKQALAGEEIVIAKNGTPLIKLSPIAETEHERTPGLSKGAASMAEDFSEPIPDNIIKEFEK